jgi:glutathione synthase/RimK-type ligase-like ATP-grasp enzyme
MKNTPSIMNPRILIIGRDFHPDGKETAALIARELQPVLAEKSATVDLLLFKDILFDISNDSIRILDARSGRDICEYDAVLMTNWFSHASVRKDMAYSVALYLNEHKVPLLNSEALYSRSTSKLSQMMLAALHGVPIPRTAFCLNLKHLEKYLQAKDIGSPFVLKDAQASRGASNFLLHNLSDITAHKQHHSERSPLVAQEFINSDKSDFRFFVAGSKIRLIIKRTGSGNSHLNNTSQGATTELVPIAGFSQDTVTHVLAMSKLLHRELTGIDIMFDSNSEKPYFLEANPIPQIATGSNVDAKLSALAEALLEAAKSK